MEVIGESQIFGKVKGLVKKYYQDRNDNIVLSFGIAGFSILKEIKPLQVRKTLYKSIQFKNERAFIRTGQPDQNEVTIMGPEDMNVSIISREELEYRKRLTEYDQRSASLYTASVSIEYLETRDSAEQTANQVFESMEKTTSILLVTEFGSEFLQSLHLAMSKLLNRRGVSHLNYVIKPAKMTHSAQKSAESAISKLREISNNVVVFDVQTQSEKLISGGVPRSSVQEKINERIARKVEVISAKMSNASELLKYQLSS